jgi:hypothetical protein
MDTFEFSSHPAWVTVGDGMGLAATYLRKTWEWWIVPVVGFAIVGGLLTGFLTNTALDTNFRDLTTSEQWSQITGLIAPAFGLGAILTILGVIATWFYAALAIHGLRGRPVTTDWVLSAGLKSLVGSILVGVVAIGLWVAFAILAVVTQGFALIALVGIIPGAMYVGIRLYFWTLAIFDGAGITESFRVSWELSRGAVLRMLGWGLAFAALQFAINIGVGIVRFPFSGLPSISAFISELVSGVFSVYTLYGAAVLYESQRWRNAPPAAAQPQAPGYGNPPGPMGGYPTPTPHPGYPPMAYPGGAYSQPWGVPSTAPVAPAYPAPASPAPASPSSTDPAPASPPAPPSSAPPPPPGGEVRRADPFRPPAPLAPSAPPASSSASGAPPLVPWAPVQQPTWSPPPGTGWVPAPQSSWAATPPPAAPAPPDAAPMPSSPEAPSAPAAEPTADDTPTEPYAPPPA